MKTKFLNIGVQPPSNLFVAPGQALRVTFYNLCIAQTVHVITRILRPDGEMREIDRPIRIAGTLPPQTTTIPLTECYILSCTVVSEEPTLLPSHLYVVVNLVSSIVASGFIIEQLLGGYVSGTTGLSYPTCPIRISTDVVPLVASTIVADPAPGADIIYTPPLYLLQRILSITFKLDTDDPVANRRIQIWVVRPTGVTQFQESSVVQAALLTYIYNFHSAYTPVLTAERQSQNFLRDVVITNVDTVRIHIFNFAATDQLYDGVFTYEERILV